MKASTFWQVILVGMGIIVFVGFSVSRMCRGFRKQESPISPRRVKERDFERARSALANTRTQTNSISAQPPQMSGSQNAPSVTRPGAPTRSQSANDTTTTTSETEPVWLTNILSRPRPIPRARARLPDVERGDDEPLPVYSKEIPEPAAPEYTEEAPERGESSDSHNGVGEITQPPPTYRP